MWANPSEICWGIFSVLPLVVLWAPIFLIPTNGLQMMNPPPQNLLIVGVGRVGSEVTRQARESRWFSSVQGVSRSRNNETHRSLAWNDVGCISECTQAANNCTHLLVTLPPNVGDTACDAIVREMGRFNSSMWVGILSTTGVYGNHDGAWVTEDSACRSTTSSSTYLDFEKHWIDRVLHFGEQRRYKRALRIFRCAGIYGPKASALHTVMRKGIACAEDGDQSNQTDNMTNRIHIKDLAAAVLRSMTLSRSEDTNRDSVVRVYNLADDLPESRSVVLSYAASLLRKQKLLPELSNMQRNHVSVTKERPNKRSRRRKLERKKVDNRRMKDELLPRLCYPTYKEGLTAVMLSNRTQW